MNILLKALGSAAGGASQAMATGASMAAIMGAVYIVDCRITAGNNHEQATNCYFVGLPIMGIGVAGRSGYKVGFDTYNPALKRPEEEILAAPPTTRRTRSSTKKA